MTEKTNHLLNEKSPYLLQHVNNPVDWYPWCDEAFEKARREDKPVFLSIGYSTCHWCHVMAHESFEDEEVAAILNEKFVSIKVDREERPDIDHIYMTVCQMLTGRGGWPLTVVLSPDKQPFFAGTYFPKYDHRGQAGLMRILLLLAEKWQTDRATLFSYGEQLTKEMQEMHVSTPQHGELSDSILEEGFILLRDSFDKDHGGFSGAPKFPTPHNLLFLLRYWHKTGEADALAMVEKTLEMMAKGGIYDQIGYGFARYSTDEWWLVPHFEKMLYDNALLLMAYTEAYQCTQNPLFKRIAQEIALYVKREMTDESGAFYSAQDADSEGEEGKYYVFTHQEIMDLLGHEEGGLFCAYYGVTPQGNFENHSNVLHVAASPGFLAQYRVDRESLENRLEESRKKLLVVRKRRIEPHKDDKILTAWNALMIAALAKSGRAFGEQTYIAVAKDALNFLEQSLCQNGRWLARYRDGQAAFSAYVDDYAFLLWAYLEMYESSYETQYVIKAKDIAKQMLQLFEDKQHGGFYFNGLDTDEVLVRNKEIYDGALPSGNAVAAYALQRLARLTENEQWNEAAERTIRTFYERVKQYPAGYTFFLMALYEYVETPCQVVVAGCRSNPDTQMVFSEIHKRFLPQATIVFSDQAERQLQEVMPQIGAHQPIGDKSTVYICEQFRCLPPITEFDDLVAKLDQLS